ncbi:MAG: hypothetical protein ACLVEJ_20555 [Parabacteroides sp.]
MREDSQYPKAKCYLQRSLSLENDSSEMITRKIVLSEIYANLNEPDSAFLLLNEVKTMVEASNDIELEAIHYSALAETEAVK